MLWEDREPGKSYVTCEVTESISLQPDTQSESSDV